MTFDSIFHNMPTAAPVLDPQTIVRDAVKNVSALSTLPEITTRIIATVENPRSSVGELHKIIAHDPSLSSRILKVVNSAFYGVSGQIGSVQRAIVLLGLTAVKNIAVAASLGQLFRGAKLGAGFSAKDLWTHCIAVGVTSRDLAKRIGAANTDEFFLAGLIHDVGILVELQTWPEKIESICSTVKNKDANFCETERQALGVDHQALGKGLAEQWKFTKVCQLVAGFHHNPAELEEDCPQAWAVHIADTLCCQNAQGFNLTAKGREIDPMALSKLGIDASVVDQIKGSMAESISGAMGVFA
jgi:HD-like signal output (HDOD) protein